MNIVVCIKQVPDTIEVRIDAETNTLIREGVDSVINPFDLHALEEGLRLREACGGVVTVLSMGPGQVESSLREAIALGADHAVLLSDRAFAGADTLATSYALARGVRQIGPFDLIICGRQAIDGDTAHIGPQLAERLDIPHVACVGRIGSLEDTSMVAERATEEGVERVKVSLPALITVTKGINEPRSPSLRRKRKALKSDLTIWSASDIAAEPNRIGLLGSPTRVVKTATPDNHRSGEMLEGTADEQVQALLARLQEIES